MILNLLIVAAGVLVLFLAVKLLKLFSVKINFFITGLDSKFNLSEISMLWKLSQLTDLEDPLSLYVSEQALSKCISHILETSKKNSTENSDETQNFLTKLYKFRTKIELASDSKRGLESSRALDNNQRLRLILKGSGIFASKIVNNGSEIAISLPIQNDKIRLKADQWDGKEVSVYLWRKGDAGYVFDTKVTHTGIFLGNQVLYLKHSNNLLRTQKRRSIRTECQLPAQLYVIKETVVDYTTVEIAPGYKCLIEDISSDGALVRIGGKGVANIQMKLQFELEGTLIIMYTVVRSVEYNSATNQSRLHLECFHIEPAMRNAILTFVYKIIPEEQKNADLALMELQNEMDENGVDGQNVTNTDSGGSINIPTSIDESFISSSDLNSLDAVYRSMVNK